MLRKNATQICQKKVLVCAVSLGESVIDLTNWNNEYNDKGADEK